MVIKRANPFPSGWSETGLFKRWVISSLLKAIRAMQAYESATKARRRKPDAPKKERLSDSAIMTVLYKLEIGMKPPEISKDLNIPVQRIYNVQYRYQIVRNDDGTQWYESKCSS